MPIYRRWQIDEVEQLFVENIALAVHSRMESRQAWLWGRLWPLMFGCLGCSMSACFWGVQIGMVSQLQQSDIVNNALDKMQKVGIPRKGPTPAPPTSGLLYSAQRPWQSRMSMWPVFWMFRHGAVHYGDLLHGAREARRQRL